MKIFVCCHKEDFAYSLPPYVPIQVGKAVSGKDLGMTGDNTGDNISSKNSSYCELTALYWMWKNCPDVAYTGLCHYRRYFVKKSFNYGTIYFAPDLKGYHLLNEADIESDLKTHDMILPNLLVLDTSIKNEYCIIHSHLDYEQLKLAVEKTSPDYLDDFVHVMEHTNKHTPFNMFICRKELMDNYCEWLFPVLAEVEKHVDISRYDAYQRRIFGFMAERMLAVFCAHNHLKVKHYPVVCLQDMPTSRFFHMLAHKVRAWLSFKLER